MVSIPNQLITPEPATGLDYQVERTWIRALAGRDLVSQELLERDTGLYHRRLRYLPQPTKAG
jgi:hypothetical protein